MTEQKKQMRINTEILIGVEEYLNAHPPAKNARNHETVYLGKIDAKIVDQVNTRLTRTKGKEKMTVYEETIKYLKRLESKEFQKKNGSINESKFYQYAYIDKSTWSELKWDKIIPKKKTLLKLVMALRLNEEEATAFLQLGHASFDAEDMQDQVILALIDLKCYDLDTVRDVLYEYGVNGAIPFESIYESSSK